MIASIQQQRRHGMAMMMVLVIIAAAGILSYALLASSQVHSQIANAAVPRLQKQYLAESGLNLAVYYLHNPSKSPVTRVYGEYGNIHYPGETGITLGSMPGTLSVTVTNISNGVFSITSVSTLDGETETARATVALQKAKAFDYAANLDSNVTLGSNINIVGGLITDGALLGGVGSVIDRVMATNGTASGGTNIPSGTDLKYPVSMTQYMPHYFYNGKRYSAKKMQATVLGGTLLDLDIVNNPANVWYADTDVKFMLVTSVPGSIIITGNKNLTVQGSLTVNPLKTLPGLLATKDVIFSGNLRSLVVNGTAYVGGEIKGTGTTTNCNFNVSGAFVSGRSGWPISGYNGQITLQHNADRATTTSVFDDLETVKSMTIQSWETNQGRPQ